MVTNVWCVRLCNIFFVRFQVYDFRGPVFKKLKERISRMPQGLKSYKQCTRRVEFCLWARWLLCLRVLYSPFWRRNSTRIALCFLRFITPTAPSGLRLFTQWRFVGGFFPTSSCFGCALLRPDDSASVRWPTILLCVQSDVIDVHRCSLPVFYVVILVFSRATLAFTSAPTSYLLSSFVPSLPSSQLIFHVQLVISIRSVD